MNTENNTPSLSNLQFIAYLTENGTIPAELEQKIGIYAIFNQDKILQYVGYSRDLALSLKQHLVRQPSQCYWLKVQTISKPSRAILENIRSNWLTENGTIPLGNSNDEAKWCQPIDAKLLMTTEEKQEYQNSEDIAKIKLLKKISRRVETEIIEKLQARNIQMEIRFNPKLKEQGLLDLK